jgi:FKBP-type peptidyl-prolyl cis-trans isomerase FklB
MKQNRWKRVLQFVGAMMFVLPLSLLTTSCSESEEEESEFANWQERNETFFNEVYNRARSTNSGEWRIYSQWSLNEEVATDAEDYIVVQVLETGTGSGCPIYTDSVRVHYSGRLMPTSSYAEGYEFDKSWTGTFRPAVAKPYSGVVNAFVDGFSTALMKMHVGDRWRVYIPYKLGYGTSSRTGIPAYSTLIFDLRLVGYSKP